MTTIDKLKIIFGNDVNIITVDNSISIFIDSFTCMHIQQLNKNLKEKLWLASCNIIKGKIELIIFDQYEI